MTEPTIGRWYRVVSGPHRTRSGVCDLISELPSGTFYRLSTRIGVIGHFRADQLTPIANPQREYVSQIAPEVQQQAMDLLTGGRVKL